MSAILFNPQCIKNYTCSYYWWLFYNLDLKKNERDYINFCRQISYVVCSVGNSHWPASPRRTTLVMEEDREFLLIFLQSYVYELRFKAWGPTTFLTEFQTLFVWLYEID